MRRFPFIWALAGFSTLAGCKKAEEKLEAQIAGPTPPASAAVVAPEGPDAAKLQRELAAVLEPALAAYNAGDQKALFADFAQTATPPATDRIFTELYEGYYKVDFGRIVALRPYTPETTLNAEFGMLVYLAQFERVKLARISANFVRENGTPKIVQLRFERVDTVAE